MTGQDAPLDRPQAADAREPGAGEEVTTAPEPEPERVSGPERLLPIACALSAMVLFASELMIMFEFVAPGREALAEQSAIDRHHLAPIVLAVFAVLALIVAIATASKPWAFAVAACGVIALGIFLLGDLPDAGRTGILDDPRQSFFDAEAVPRAGFWMLLVGALGLAISGAALATLTSEQLARLRPRGRQRPPRAGRARTKRDAEDAAQSPTGTQILTDAERYGEEVRSEAEPSEDRPRAKSKRP
jgi:hypothetical protein